jgi:alkylation response protein AidB-like acyl-CoA dehydrogenase
MAARLADGSEAVDLDGVRALARAWFASNWDRDRPLGEWWTLLVSSGWGFPGLPEGWFGKGLPRAAVAVVDEERRRAGAAAAPMTLGVKAIVPLLLAHGSEKQKERCILPTLTGQAVWCELFSEPGAGSDLASLATRAARDGDEWVVNGQKVWSSGAPMARWGLLAARTDTAAAKQRGLTCFILDMGQPGVEARPLRTMAGDATFSEVFLTDARVHVDDVVGEVGRGWELTKEALALERTVISPSGGGGGGMAENKLLPLDQPAGVTADAERAGRQRGAMVTGSGATALIDTLLDTFGGATDPVVRQRVAQVHTLVEVVRFCGLRARAARARADARGLDASTMKLLSGRVTIALRELAIQLEGAHGMLHRSDAPLGGVVQKLVLVSPSMSIMVGTDEIQRNLIADRVLGLPAEPSVDKNVPWNQLRVGTQWR